MNKAKITFFTIYTIIIVIIIFSFSSFQVNKAKKRFITLIDATNTKIESINTKIEQLKNSIYHLQLKNNQLSQELLEVSFGKDKILRLVDLLKKYDTYSNNQKIELKRIGKEEDGGYVIPSIALEKSDALLGYGVAGDISFEEEYSSMYNKPSYGFDCTIEGIKITNPLTKFVPECVAPKGFEPLKADGKKYSTLEEELASLGLSNKKVFVKMDIEGAEYNVFTEFLDANFAENITGIVMEIHLNEDISWFAKALLLLENIEKQFYLVNVHGNNCGYELFKSDNTTGQIPKLLQLTFINKNLVERAQLSKDQSHPSEIDTPNCSMKPDDVFEILN